MAVVAGRRQLEINMQGDNGRRVEGRAVETVVNERTGLATQHQRLFSAEEDEDGNLRIKTQDKITNYNLVRFRVPLFRHSLKFHNFMYATAAPGSNKCRLDTIICLFITRKKKISCEIKRM